MAEMPAGSMDHPFPPVGPEVKIVASTVKIDAIDCPELQYRITIDGVVYVHCDCTGRAHDTLTRSALF